MNEALTVNDVLRLVHEEMDKIDEVRLFYELKKRKLKYVKLQQRILKVVIALAKMRLPITSCMVNAVFNYDRVNKVIPSLHNLGDKHLLVLKRVIGRHYEWIPSPMLNQIINCLDGKKQ